MPDLPWCRDDGLAGTGSAGGLAAWVAMQLRFKPEPEDDRIARLFPELNLQPLKAGGGK